MSVCLTAIKTDTQAPENAENTLRLMPRVHPRIQRFLQQQALLFNLIDGVGSPLNLMFPQNMADNVESFQEAYKRHHLRGRIYFTSKPCKSSALMRQASLAPIHIDVSSTRSMKEAIGCGFSPDRLEATGPKNPEYILTALQLDVLLNVDNFEELKLIAALHKKLDLKRKARIFIRLGGFSSSTIHMTPQDDVFGIQVKDGPLILDWLVAHQDIVDFQGFSFHLSSRDSNLPRLIAIENMLELTFAAIKRGLKPKGINIGGGYSVQYAETAQGWLDYNDALKDSVMGNIPSQTWNNSGLGYRDANGVLAGGPHFMNHYSPLVKGDQLSDLLSQRLTKFKNATIASIIGDSLLELYIEPGRGMLDQCGITLARVNFSKKSVWDENLTFADINQTKPSLDAPQELDRVICYLSQSTP